MLPKYMPFSSSEHSRYARHFILPEIGETGQLRLKNARILCVGAGGLAAPVLAYLAAAGVGTLGLVDNDQIELSNLQRQILFTTENVGQLKTTKARNYLLALNPEIEVDVFSTHLTLDNADELLSAYDIILDCTDNFTARYIINDTCVRLNKPCVHASIYRFQGQCTVFHASQGPCYRCLYPTPPIADSIPDCAEAGVVGALTGMLGSIQAMETLKLILQQGNILIGRVLLIDALAMQFREINIKKNTACLLCTSKKSRRELTMPNHQCSHAIPCTNQDEISISAAKELLAKNENAMLLDVREPNEYAQGNIGGLLIPLGELAERCSELDPQQTIIIHCRSGGRSLKAVSILRTQGFAQVFSLQGGMKAWVG